MRRTYLSQLLLISRAGKTAYSGHRARSEAEPLPICCAPPRCHLFFAPSHWRSSIIPTRTRSLLRPQFPNRQQKENSVARSSRSLPPASQPSRARVPGLCWDLLPNQAFPHPVPNWSPLVEGQSDKARGTRGTTRTPYRRPVGPEAVPSRKSKTKTKSHHRLIPRTPPGTPKSSADRVPNLTALTSNNREHHIWGL